MKNSHFANSYGPFTKSQIIKCIINREIDINPFPGDKSKPDNSKSISTASIDLSLSDELRIPLNPRELHEKIKLIKNEKTTRISHISPMLSDKKPNYLFFTKPARIKKNHAYILRPGEKVIGITKEKLTLKNGICAFIFARSSIARFFVVVEFAPFIEPGVNNQQVLEMKNDAPWPIALVPDTKICKVVFFRSKSASDKYEKYLGAYSDQKLIQPLEKNIENVGHPIKKIIGLEEDIMILDDNFMNHLDKNWPVF